MGIQVIRADERGTANHGWLQAKHSFSFANYYDPQKVHFGKLRVLNDDIIAAGQGFGTHPHDNMEIITIPLSGDLEHKDSMGNTSVIREGEIQVMSAGSGILHSEFNANKSKDLNLFQIWVFPKLKNVEPRYQQLPVSDLAQANELYQVLSPNSDDAGVWIHQDAWFHMGELSKGTQIEYVLKNEANGIYLMNIEGELLVEHETLGTRDAISITQKKSISLKAESNVRLLLMEIPLV